MMRNTSVCLAIQTVSEPGISFGTVNIALFVMKGLM